MKYYCYVFILLFKFVISIRDVTFGIRAMVCKRFLGSMGSELIVFRLRVSVLIFLC